MELASPVIVVMFDSEQIVTSADRRCIFFENAGASDSLAASCVCNPDTDVCFGLHGSLPFNRRAFRFRFPEIDIQTLSGAMRSCKAGSVNSLKDIVDTPECISCRPKYAMASWHGCSSSYRSTCCHAHVQCKNAVFRQPSAGSGIGFAS